MEKILFSLVLLTFLIGGLSVLAQGANLSSPGITPDNPFYFLKTWKEQIQTFFTFGLENKVKQYLHLADVRLAEYQKMIEKGKTKIAQNTLDKYEKQLNNSIQKIEELKQKGQNIEPLLQKMEDMVAKHSIVLERNLQKAPEAAKQGLEKALENVRELIEKKAEKYCEANNDCVPVGCNCSCSGCGGFSYEEIINKNFVDKWYQQHNCVPPKICLTVCCPQRTVTCESNKCGVKEESSIIEPGTQSYIACECGCCGGVEPATRCLYHSKGDDIQKIIEEDKKKAQSPICPTAGCSQPIEYIYCD